MSLSPSHSQSSSSSSASSQSSSRSSRSSQSSQSSQSKKDKKKNKRITTTSRGRSPTIRPRPRQRQRQRRQRGSKSTTVKTENISSSSFPSTYNIILFIKCIFFSIIVTFVILYFVLGYDDEVMMILEEIQSSSKSNIDSVLSSVSKNMSTIMSSTSTTQYEYKYNQENNKIFELVDLSPKCKEKGALVRPNDDANSSRNNNEQQCRNILTDEMKQLFEEDGVIVIRGLLSPNLFKGLNESSSMVVNEQLKKVGGISRIPTGKQFFMNKMRPAFTNDQMKDNDETLSSSSTSTSSASSGFRDVALSSLIPQVAAELLGMEYENENKFGNCINNDNVNKNENNNGNCNVNENDNLNDNVNNNENDINHNKQGENLKLLRDILMVKDADQFICGWHVDDLGFWPATASSPGINAWIAIDDMSSSTGGNFAISVGTHNVPWKDEIYELTGSTTTLPKDGFKDAKDMFENRKGAGTCNIKHVNHELHDKLEERKRVFDLEAGDIIFMTRWLFHRTIPFEKEVIKEKKKNGELHHLLSRRYSIRYAPGTAELPKGYGTELSILWNKENEGKTLDFVGANDAAWYPQCWPHSTSIEEQNDIQELIKMKIPFAETRRKERVNEMKPFLQQLGKQQRDQLKLNARNAVHTANERKKKL